MNRMTYWLYRHPDGRLTQEVWGNSAPSLHEVLSLAHRDALTMVCGRELVALVRIEERHEKVGPAPAEPLAVQREVLRAVGLAELPEPADEPSVHAVDWHSDIQAAPWWSVTCCFGSGSIAGLALLRCACRDDDPTALVTWAAECIAHQSSLYPVTPMALPFVVDLLAARVPAWEFLAEWLVVIANAAAELGPEAPEEYWLSVRDQLPPIIRAVEGQRIKDHVAAGQRIQDGWPMIARRLRALPKVPAAAHEALRLMNAFE